MEKRKSNRLSGGSRIGRFFRDRDGATAIEFAALVLPFALLVFAILEICISFAVEELLANATDDVARKFRTGQIEAANTNEKEVRDLICDQLEMLAPSGCPGLIIDLRQFATFEEAANVPPGPNTDGSVDTFDPGPAQSKNMLRVFYDWPALTGLMTNTLSKDTTTLFATTTWQNEPF